MFMTFFDFVPGGSGDPMMKKVQLTNVHREDDRTTRALRTLTNAQATIWLKSSPRRPWTDGQLQMAGLFVFNCALWRAFGTATFALAAGFVQDWTPEVEEQVCNIAIALLHKGVNVFTTAYGPANKHHHHLAAVSKSIAAPVSQMRQVCPLHASHDAFFVIGAAMPEDHEIQKNLNALMFGQSTRRRPNTYTQ